MSKLPPSWPVWQDHGDERGSKLFFNGLLEYFDSKHGLGIHFLELGIFLFQGLQPFGIGFIHEAVFLRHRWRVAMDICFCLRNASLFGSHLSDSSNKRMVSACLCLFCFIVSCFVYPKLLTRFGPVFLAAAKSFKPGIIKFKGFEKSGLIDFHSSKLVIPCEISCFADIMAFLYQSSLLYALTSSKNPRICSSLNRLRCMFGFLRSTGT